MWSNTKKRNIQLQRPHHSTHCTLRPCFLLTSISKHGTSEKDLQFRDAKEAKVQCWEFRYYTACDIEYVIMTFPCTFIKKVELSDNTLALRKVQSDTKRNELIEQPQTLQSSKHCALYRSLRSIIHENPGLYWLQSFPQLSFAYCSYQSDHFHHRPLVKRRVWLGDAVKVCV